MIRNFPVEVDGSTSSNGPSHRNLNACTWSDGLSILKLNFAMENQQTPQEQVDQPLGASEFASTLNGVNPRAILDVLKRFSRTVQRQREIALDIEAANEVFAEDDSDESDDEADPEQPPAKKLKKSEEWKKDTRDYHVPFVGTAVARGDTAQVVKGEWPTGLLRQYLEKSPMAIELTGDDWVPSSNSQIHKTLLRRKQLKLSRAISKAYLQVISELVSAAVSIGRLRQFYLRGSSFDGDFGEASTSITLPFLTSLLNKRLSGFFQLLSEETQNGRGKSGVYGGCDTLVPPVLGILQQLSMTSTSNARLVCRYLHEDMGEGILKVLLRSPPPPKTNTQSVEKKNAIMTKPSRDEALRLAAVLLGTNDPAALVYICSEGSRERKVKPGMLYMAFREGLSNSTHTVSISDALSPNYCGAVVELLGRFRTFLQSETRQKAVGIPVLAEMLSKDALNNLSHLATYASPLSSDRSFRDVLSASDDLESCSTEEMIGVEARRLLFLLMSNTDYSPPLRQIESRSHSQGLALVLIQLFQQPTSGLEVREFLVYSLNQTPQLVPQVFRMLPLPDPKAAYSFLSTLSFVNKVLKHGPTAHECLNAAKSQGVPLDHEMTLLTVVPAKMRRHALSKAIQNSNPLVVLESLKTIRVLLNRFQLLIAAWGGKSTDEYVEELTSSLSQCIPDLQVLLTIRTKFDAFGESQGNILVCHGLYTLLEAYATVIPVVVHTSSFDWMKLLPDSATLSGADPLIQQRLLASLGLLLKASKVVRGDVVSLVRAVLETMMRTNDNATHASCSYLVTQVVREILKPRCRDDEAVAYLSLELSWWMDVLTVETLDEFCDSLRITIADPLGSLSNVVDVLSSVDILENADLSNLLVVSLCRESVSNAFASAWAQVATRCLLVHRSSLSVARLLVAMGGKLKNFQGEATEAGKALFQYSFCIVEQDDNKSSDMLLHLQTLVKCTFSPSSAFWDLLFNPVSANKPVSSDQTLQESIEICRFAIHMNFASRERKPYASATTSIILHHIPNLILMSRDHNGVGCLVSPLLSDLRRAVGVAASLLQVLEISCPFQNQGTVEVSEGIEAPLLHGSYESRLFLLRQYLYGHTPPLSGTTQLQLSYVEDSESSKRYAPPDRLVRGLPQADVIDPSCFTVQGLGRLFSGWWKLAGRAARMDETSLDWNCHFARLLASILETRSVASTTVVSLFLEMQCDEVLDRCLLVAVPKGAISPELFPSELVDVLISLEPSRFLPALFSKFKQTEIIECTTWKSGLLDETMLKALTIGSFVTDDTSLLGPFSVAVRNRVSTSLANILNDKKGTFIRLVQHAVRATKGEVLNSEISAQLYRALLSAVDNSKNVNVEVFRELCALGYTAVEYSKSESHEELSPLKSSVLQGTAELVLRMFKKVSAEGSQLSGDLHTMLSLLRNRNFPVDSKMFQQDNKHTWMKLCRSSLKHGIHDSSSPPPFATLSLELVTVAFERMSEDLSTRHLFPEPHEIFAMCTSHSKFLAMMKRERGNVLEEMDRSQLIRLLHVTLKRSKVSVEFGSELWAVLFSKFEAGLSDLDTEIAKFWSLAVSRNGLISHTPYLDEVRWNSNGVESQENKRWTWLLDALDARRIRDTVTHFPIFDTLDLSPTPLSATPQEEETRDEDSSDDSDAEDSLELNESLASDDTAENTATNDVPRPQEEDIRYSPAVVLTLVLGALDSSASEDLHETSNDIKFDGSFVGMSRTLIERGVVALCLSSLASTCQTVRTQAVSILGLMLAACVSEEAHRMTSWRDRPQMVMLLNSVQRALVLRGYKDSTNMEPFVPALPSHVSTFLARASFAVAKPDDPLYVPLNRYFLKTEADHGAFPDTNRLPAFMSLFCSSSEDGAQSRRERVWALNLIKDGFLEEPCFRLVASCHAPELLLGSMENIPLLDVSSEMKGFEQSLVFDAISTFLCRGGKRAARYLLVRTGLLSWLQSFMRSKSEAEALQSMQSRISWCELVSSSGKAALQLKESRFEVLAHEICGLTGLVVKVVLEKMSDPKYGELMAAGCGALASLRGVLEQLQSTSEVDLSEEHVGGICPGDALQFLQSVPLPSLPSVIPMICALPFRATNEHIAKEELCTFLISSHDSNGSLAKTVAKRVFALIDAEGGNFGTEDSAANVSTALLANRALFVESEETLAIWGKCLETMLPHLRHGSDLLTLASRFCTVHEIVSMGDRKARLAALAAKAGRTRKQEDSEQTENDASADMNTAQPQAVVFRNYAPKDANLEMKDESPPKRQKMEENSSSALEEALTQAQEEISRNVGRGNEPEEVERKKINWDLKRDIQSKLTKLEKRTQKAIVEMLKERLEREAAEEADGDDSDLD
eukprot:Nitzschia sp. Nitz4//scaffold3_size479765//151860//159289//NITZ4_000065-RA/size479765-augustus-gene-0.16-mRNA-1//1//CDS//3329550653//527//frame0